MNTTRNTIPDLHLNLIGKKNPIKHIGAVLDWPCWNGYMEEEVGFSGRKKRATTGLIKMTVESGVNADGSFNISPEQVHAYWYLVDQQEKMRSLVSEGLVLYFPRLLEEEYEYFDKEEGGFPPLSEIKPGYDFKSFIRLDSIEILDIEKDDSAYVLWNFSCSWDPEHGFMIVTHKDRVIDIGQDYDPFKIEKDNGTYEEDAGTDIPSTNPKPYSWKKKWWQFWKKY